MSEDLSGETNKRIYFNARKLNENVKLDELGLIEIDYYLNDTQVVDRFLLFRKNKCFIHVTELIIDECLNCVLTFEDIKKL